EQGVQQHFTFRTSSDPVHEQRPPKFAQAAVVLCLIRRLDPSVPLRPLVSKDPMETRAEGQEPLVSDTHGAPPREDPAEVAPHILARAGGPVESTDLGESDLEHQHPTALLFRERQGSAALGPGRPLSLEYGMAPTSAAADGSPGSTTHRL